MTTCRTLLSTNGVKKFVGMAESNKAIISLNKALLSVLNATTGKNTAHEQIDTEIISNIRTINRRITLKPILLNVVVFSMTQILATTEMKTVGIVTATINFIMVSSSGTVSPSTKKA